MRISEWIADNGWTGFIERIDSGYPEAQYSAVLTEGFGTYETLEEAEAYLIENDYKKVEVPTDADCPLCDEDGYYEYEDFIEGSLQTVVQVCPFCEGSKKIDLQESVDHETTKDTI